MVMTPALWEGRLLYFSEWKLATRVKVTSGKPAGEDMLPVQMADEDKTRYFWDFAKLLGDFIPTLRIPTSAVQLKKKKKKNTSEIAQCVQEREVQLKFNTTVPTAPESNKLHLESGVNKKARGFFD